jgi:hypothetical protein
MLQRSSMDRKRRDSERRKAVRSTPSPEAIQARLENMADAVRDLQQDVEALIRRPNVLPWRRKPTDREEKG